MAMNSPICDEETKRSFLAKISEGSFTKEENDKSHFGVYFLPYNPETKEVFIVHHRKANLWIAPGGHVDRGENLFQTLNREIGEEIGVNNFFHEPQKPFLLTTTPIDNDVQACKMHYDVWYLMPTDGSGFKVDMREFYDARWLSIAEARKIVANPQNLRALNVIEYRLNEVQI